MQENYTTFNEESLSNYYSWDSADEALEYINNPESFRTFDKGLIEILKRKNYSGDLTNKTEMSAYLIEKLRDINSSIESKTVSSWFTGKHRPKIEKESRQKMYEICFALNLDLKETMWFFQHVYYDRAFNYHNIKEAVYYFAFSKNLNYFEASSIIETINNSKPQNIVPKISENYTSFVQSQIEDFNTKEELIDFLVMNKHNFNTWNQSALSKIKNLISDLLPPESAKTDIASLKDACSKNKLTLSNIENYKKLELGLIIQEIIFDAEQSGESISEFINNDISGKNVFANSFLLKRILTTDSGIKKSSKEINIPYIVRNNFPNKHTLSKILEEAKIGTSTSYDSIRKIIILFDFFRFWINAKINKKDFEEMSEHYIKEAEYLLRLCGYEPLYAGNPYDWIFLCAAQSEDPLVFFRSFIVELLTLNQQ